MVTIVAASTMQKSTTIVAIIVATGTQKVILQPNTAHVIIIIVSNFVKINVVLNPFTGAHN